jgi:hypothetical protein
MPPELIVALVVLALPLWWWFVLWATSWFTGWRALARHYRRDAPFAGPSWRFQSARVGWSDYNACLRIGVSAEGLFLAALLPFRPGHPPLLLPWSDLDASSERGFFGSRLLLRARQAPRVAIRLSERLAGRLADAVGEHWPAVAPRP